MKKKILISSFDLAVGGVERSLIGLLGNIDYSRYEVDLMLYRHEGEFLSLLPEGPMLLPEVPQYATFRKPIVQIVREGYSSIGATRLLAKNLANLHGKWKRTAEPGYLAIQYGWALSTPFLPELAGEYDAAVSFLWPHYFVGRRVKARRKIGWIHTDYSNIAVNTGLDNRMWSDMHDIVAVSDECRNAFLQTFPEHEARTRVIENILSPAFVREQAELELPAEMPARPRAFFDGAGEAGSRGIGGLAGAARRAGPSGAGAAVGSSGLTGPLGNAGLGASSGAAAAVGAAAPRARLVTVARLSHAKGIDEAARACRLLADRGFDIEWFVVGYGPQEAEVKELIRELGIQDRFFLLGKKTNPYPYMKACDLYVQPSRYEGKAVTVREAQILGKPVLITDFPTAKSQVRDGVDGLITPLGAAGIADGIAKLLANPALARSLAESTAAADYGNRGEIDKLYALIEGAV